MFESQIVKLIAIIIEPKHLPAIKLFKLLCDYSIFFSVFTLMLVVIPYERWLLWGFGQNHKTHLNTLKHQQKRSGKDKAAKSILYFNV